MSTFADLRASCLFQELLTVSERLGHDPMQVQGPGGNTSVKANGAMWVKASGTWLAEAREREIMVPVDAAGIRSALAKGDATAEDGAAFTANAENASGLRPSIETSVHAVLDWPVVLHTHCVATIATAVRADAEAVIRDKLAGLDAVYVPYVKPGADLARAIRARVNGDTRVIVLGNHGLVACGEQPAEAEALVYEVARRLEPDIGPGTDAAPGLADGIVGPGWMPVSYGPTDMIARSPELLAIADGTTLYPDHLIFLGPGVAVAEAGEDAQAAATRVSSGGAARKLVLFPGQGAAIPADASPSVVALARALGDVVCRIDPSAALTRLSPDDEAALLNWDAEKHRQALEAARSAAP